VNTTHDLRPRPRPGNALTEGIPHGQRVDIAELLVYLFVGGLVTGGRLKQVGGPQPSHNLVPLPPVRLAMLTGIRPDGGPLGNAETGMRRHCQGATVTTGHRRRRRLAAGGYDEAPGQVSFRA
jgi:hypothetical protein